MKTRDRILELREQGLTYSEIVKEVGCSKSTVNYHCSNGKDTLQKRKSRKKYLDYKYRKRKEQQAFVREFTNRHKGLCGCSSCGIKDHRVLDYDHINPADKKYLVSQLVNLAYSLKTIKDEIRKCQVLCSNCHRIRTYEENHSSFRRLC